ncbi:TBC1 domain family member 22B like protein [Argiope bruennichi]|uniref:TBC1 domain family member 22B like protein n=1 Tax=Argiope bruennichi TaxID=94029 RepID=A0A8T0E4Z3_ARGBR|nr:TBC1 domain family member 22B like protein [Argiope bruennichi]
MQNSYDVPDNKSVSWKKSDNVPGRPVSSATQNLHLIRDSKSISPKKASSKSKHRKTSSSSSFQEFQDSTEDAWDIGDDEFCLTTDVSIHSKVAQSTAMKVLSNHSKGALPFSNAAILNNSNSNVSSVNPSDLSKKDSDSSSSTISSYETKAAALQRLATQKGDIFGLKPKGFGRKNPPNFKFDGSPSEKCRLKGISNFLNSQNTDLKELRKLSWSGIPVKVRPITWKLLSGYLPTCLERRESFLQRRKEEYQTFVSRYYDIRNEDVHHETYRQIHIDVPRMSPLVPLFQQEIVQMAFERILYILAIRHPASGYVQGMNDLVTPFFVVFLQDFIPVEADVESYDVSQLSSDALQQVEADSYWCMAKLLDGIQDNYTFAQPGIQKKVHMLKELIQRIDAPLHNHLKRHSIEYLQFSFRWMNNLLMRELPLACTIRLWDTYLSEPNGFSNFHLYVCAAFLKYWSRELLQEKDFQGLMLTLQNLPTLHWSDNEISLLVAEAYRLKYMFDDAPNHLQPRES